MESETLQLDGMMLELLSNAIAASGYLDDAEIALFTNNITPAPDTPISSYVEADYAGYAREAVTWYPVSVTDGGEPETVGRADEFRPTNSTVPNMVYGVMLIAEDGGLLAVGRFVDGPYPMQTALDQIIVQFRVRFSPTGFVVTVS